MSDEHVPADYAEMDLLAARRFDKKVRENFMPAIVSTIKQIINDYGPLEGVCVDVGCGTAIFAIELYRHSNIKIYALEKVKAIYEVASMNIEKEGLKDRIIPVLGNAHDLPFEDGFADFVISRGSYHCWKDKVWVFKEIYRILKKAGIGFIGGGFGRYATEEELTRMKTLRDCSLGEDAKIYSEPDKLKRVIDEAGISKFRIIFDKSGLWAELQK
jgi:ubiquinone/menaquinone biosynthesis C-methylase UbiE